MNADQTRRERKLWNWPAEAWEDETAEEALAEADLDNRVIRHQHHTPHIQGHFSHLHLY